MSPVENDGMTAESRIARAFGLDDLGWARHANPWSGWSRFVTCLPLLVLALWSRVWLGSWSLLATAIAIAWIWLNPRAFPPARDDAAWITRGVLGERIWSDRHRIAVPDRYRVVPHVLNATALAGAVFLVWGIVALEAWPTVFGVALITGGKLWFIDRMALLYEDVVAAHPERRYRRPG